jgi:uncharacterized protein YjbJ (UPF0337 family)
LNSGNIPGTIQGMGNIQGNVQQTFGNGYAQQQPYTQVAGGVQQNYGNMQGTTGVNQGTRIQQSLGSGSNIQGTAQTQRTGQAGCSLSGKGSLKEAEGKITAMSPNRIVL